MAVVAEDVGRDGSIYKLYAGRCGSKTIWSLLVLPRGKRAYRAYRLDYDQRHRRLFLSERDQRRLGVSGLSALEKMVRQVMSR